MASGLGLGLGVRVRLGLGFRVRLGLGLGFRVRVRLGLGLQGFSLGSNVMKSKNQWYHLVQLVKLNKNIRFNFMVEVRGRSYGPLKFFD